MLATESRSSVAILSLFYAHRFTYKTCDAVARTRGVLEFSEILFGFLATELSLFYRLMRIAERSKI